MRVPSAADGWERTGTTMPDLRVYETVYLHSTGENGNSDKGYVSQVI